MQPFAALLLALTLASSTTASPITDVAAIKQRRQIGVRFGLGPIDIYPSWSNPNAETVWQISSKQCVQWDSSTVPPQHRADNASLLFGYIKSDGNLQMDSENPLATNIVVGNDEVNITVPDPETLGFSASSLIVSLVGPEIFGLNGAISPTFRITN